MAVSDDHIFHLGSGTELSVEAAIGDLTRVRRFLADQFNSNDQGVVDDADGLISDVDHVVELIHQLQAGYHRGHGPLPVGDLTWAISHTNAAHWNLVLAEKPGLSEERKDIYIHDAREHLQSSLSLMRGSEDPE